MSGDDAPWLAMQKGTVLFFLKLGPSPLQGQGIMSPKVIYGQEGRRVGQDKLSRRELLGPQQEIIGD